MITLFFRWENISRDSKITKNKQSQWSAPRILTGILMMMLIAIWKAKSLTNWWSTKLHKILRGSQSTVLINSNLMRRSFWKITIFARNNKMKKKPKQVKKKSKRKSNHQQFLKVNQKSKKHLWHQKQKCKMYYHPMWTGLTIKRDS